MIETRTAGTSLTKVDAAQKARGAAPYAVDTPWPGTLHGAVVRAEPAHAMVVGIDAEGALARPGVRAVVTGADLQGLFLSSGITTPITKSWLSNASATGASRSRWWSRRRSSRLRTQPATWK